ncbi:TetR/AcrR family transcriptional regulator [Mycobacterium paraintracellulare]|uniref:TetR/AcrR family transcriptional regulator n=1 Tax=Mycobacterium paraintracellulare TaxID=1138383 RepID=UPI0019160DDD|nr:TetR/AcrR family transcriptional regulator [Mycobacterium paraintracellulare]
MRVSQKVKDRSGRRIVVSASRLIRERGVEGASIDDVMRGAGMTSGGFYRHFDSKESLISAALQEAFDQVLSDVEFRCQDADPTHAVNDFQSYYLSKQHLRDRAGGCPVAALAGELGRGPETCKLSLTSGVQRMINLIAAGLTGPPRQRRSEAARRLATMAGAVMIARATNQQTAELILEATRTSTPAGQKES